MDLEVKAELYRIIDQVNRRCLDGVESNSQLFVAEEDKNKLNGDEYTFPMPKNNRTNWYKAMRFLELNDVLYFWVKDADGIGVKMDFTPEEAEEELYCTVDNFYRPKFVEFCREYKIDLSKPVRLIFSARLELEKDNSLSVVIDDREKLFFGRLGVSDGRSMLRIATMLKNGRGVKLKIEKLNELGSSSRVVGINKVLESKMTLKEEKALTEYFKTGLLVNVVKKVIDVYPDYILVPHHKDIDIATYLDLRQQAKNIEEL